MRLDVFLAERGLADSRTEAKKFIASGSVSVNGKEITKPSYDVNETDDIKIDRSSKKYVGRGGLKLEAAIKAFDISVNGRLCLDIGASSGGFTDCLLQNGASHVIAVDSGFGQMSERLRDDERVTVIENFNARYMKPSDFEYIPTLAVMDVSFISATYIIPAVKECMRTGGDFVCLIKPQFEVGKSGVGKGGIVKNEKVRSAAVEKVTFFAKSYGFMLESIIESPVAGGDGNIEFLAHFKIGGRTVE